MIRNITIIGLGVIGGSLGMALKKKKPEIKVCGIDTRQEVLGEAVARKAIDWGTLHFEAAVRDAEVIFLATPMTAMPVVCQEIVPFLKPGTIITDVGSTKRYIVNTLQEILPPTVQFVGGHPMAGSEKGGLQGAHELLFENAAYILTPTLKTSSNAMETVKQLVQDVGAKVILLSPEEHDRKVAAVSHLPHLVASALVSTVGELEEREKGYFALAAGGFRDSTRIAASNSEMWCDIFLQNEKALLPLVRGFRESLERLEKYIEEKNAQALLEMLRQSRLWREGLPTGLKGIVPQLHEAVVIVPDRPGIIAELSNLLGEQGINISDIEIQPVREDDGGIIRFGFIREEWRNQAVEILQTKGFPVRKTGV
ncbi:MAG: prephenate dehydrogenase/arogenate dehydrogenase family protein [Bacillota bacterium]|uniref:Prephenate dehydrogenase n=1 Tax=Thermanaerosceptrum fracticalcis TaxID=1712410 RepID=A0A7G6E6E8_THEFR|nr:prephenate dehydrogenase [Thermanaerosceptrum fracticalcis]QNB47652.1 prephenate dehydrogenase/arogenate dehydrogenase family protein [Thermanaerosceptrum fracticalcis]